MRSAGGAGGSGDQGTSTCPVTEPEHCPEKEGEAQPGDEHFLLDLNNQSNSHT